MFNALRYTEELERAGFTKNQAETSVKMLIDLMNENFATKSDLNVMELALRSDMKAIENSLRSEMKASENSLRTEIKAVETSVRELEYKLTNKLGAMMVVGIGIIATLIKFMPNH